MLLIIISNQTLISDTINSMYNFMYSSIAEIHVALPTNEY